MMITKGVTFNVSKADQKDLLDYVLAKNNFSGYIKRLIELDKAANEKKKLNGGGIKINL